MAAAFNERAILGDRTNIVANVACSALKENVDAMGATRGCGMEVEAKAPFQRLSARDAAREPPSTPLKARRPPCSWMPYIDDEFLDGGAKAWNSGATSELVGACACDLRRYWSRCMEDGSLTDGNARVVVQKFGRMGPQQFAAILCRPPQCDPPPPPRGEFFGESALFSTPPTAVAQEDKDQAPSSPAGPIQTPPPRVVVQNLHLPTPSPPVMPGARRTGAAAAAAPPPTKLMAPPPMPTVIVTAAAAPATPAAPAVLRTGLRVSESLTAWQALQEVRPEHAMDASLSDLCSSVLRAKHQESERHRPVAEAVLTGMREEERERVILWLFMCAGFLDDSVIHAAVLLLDRFSAVATERIDARQLHLIVIAIVSIAVKVSGGADEFSRPRRLREILLTLSQHQYSVEVIFATEAQVLKALNCDVASPSVLDFLHTWVLPLGSSAFEHGPASPSASAALAGGATSSATTPPAILARFLLQLSLLDVRLHYKYPQSVIAASAAYIAMWCTAARPERMVALLRDASMCQDTREVDANLGRAVLVVQESLNRPGTDSANTQHLARSLSALASGSVALREVLRVHCLSGHRFLTPPDVPRLLRDLLGAQWGERADQSNQPPRSHWAVAAAAAVRSQQAPFPPEEEEPSATPQTPPLPAAVAVHGCWPREESAEEEEEAMEEDEQGRDVEALAAALEQLQQLQQQKELHQESTHRRGRRGDRRRAAYGRTSLLP